MYTNPEYFGPFSIA